MLFGLSNTSTSFQSYINKILAKKLNIFVIIHLDDIFIYIKDPKQAYIDIVYWVLDILRNNHLFTNLKKCCFYKDEVCFLDYIILTWRVKIEDKRIKNVRN